MPDRSRSRSSSTASDTPSSKSEAGPTGGSNLERLRAMLAAHELEGTHESEGEGTILQAFYDLTEWERKSFVDDGQLDRLGEAVSTDVEEIARDVAQQEAKDQAIRVEALMTHATVQEVLESQLAPRVAPMVSVALAERFQTARFPPQDETVDLRGFPNTAASLEVVVREDAGALVEAGLGREIVMDTITTGASLTTTRPVRELFGVVADYGGRVEVGFDLHFRTPSGAYAFASPSLVFTVDAAGLALGDLSVPSLDVDFHHLDLDGAW